MHTGVARSLAIIADGQASSGAYVACPAYPTYRYCWFRDGTFIAQAMDLWDEHASAEHFYAWAARSVVQRADAIERCVEAAAQGRRPDPADLLHTRYTLGGRPGGDDWPNFQLDGFGTLLWGFRRHAELAGAALPAEWRDAVRLLVRYLAALWREPNYDCWEEFPDRIAVSTLAAIYAGLRASAVALGPGDPAGSLASTTAAELRAEVLRGGVRDGHLIKQLDGTDAVDAGLLWACVPFGAYGLLAPDDPLMRATALRIQVDLTGGTGGIHRYRADTFYGGGEWILLTALLGEYVLAMGDRAGAEARLAWVERRFDAEGRLPEQVSDAPLDPFYVQEWVDRWGPVAKPLLWSHATYLSLRAALDGRAIALE